jgi:Xaa-Pro dipeptidase
MGWSQAVVMTAQLAATEHEVRLAALRTTMARQGWSAMAVASPENIYYLVGLDHLGYFAFTLLVVPAQGRPVLVTREMERPTVQAQVACCDHATFADGTDAATAAVAQLAKWVPAGATLAAEEESMFFPPSIRARLHTALPRRRWADATSTLAAARATKSSSEILEVRRAAAVSDEAMRAARAVAAPGVTEQAVAAAVHHAMFTAGGRQPGFAPLIRPLWMLDQEHVSWSDRVLEPGIGLFIELSGCVRRYHAPLARTLYIGHLPGGAVEAHGRALRGLAAAREALRPGVYTGEVYAAWERAVASNGPVPRRHHCGYLVGIGFPPSWVGGGEVLGIRPGGMVRVEAGMTFHLMSWVPGHVVSDTALVTAGGAELLTTTPHTLTVLR